MILCVDYLLRNGEGGRTHVHCLNLRNRQDDLGQGRYTGLGAILNLLEIIRRSRKYQGLAVRLGKNHHLGEGFEFVDIGVRGLRALHANKTVEDRNGKRAVETPAN